VGWRFRKSIRIVPGVRLNLGKKGASVSVGRRGITHTIGGRGSRTTLGIPGTGVSYSISHKRPRSAVPWVIVLIAIVVLYLLAR